MKKRRRRWFLALLVLAVGVLAVRAWLAPASVPDGSYVVMPLRGAYAEGPPGGLVTRLLRGQDRTLLDLLTTLRHMARDDRVKGVVVEIANLEIGWAKAQDLRDALGAVRTRGKRVIAYLEQEVTAGNLEYYLASVADEVYLAPAGTAPLSGLMSQFFFLGGVWDKLDVEMQVEKVREYKTFGDMLVNKTMTPQHREMADSLLDSINAQFIGGVASARGLEPRAVQAAVDECPISPDGFAATGLSNGTKFLDEIRTHLVGADGHFVKFDDYEAADAAPSGTDGKLAVIYAVGTIHTGESSNGVSGPSVGSDTLIDAFDKAMAADEIKAIVLRIDSPGGSALASDLIWRAVWRARERKPVIVSMSDVAGSGGYYIAAAGSKIVAQPATFTGSIGVVVAKPNIRGLLANLGVTTETLSRGKYARLEDVTTSMSADERIKVVASMEKIYELFVERVAQGRQLDRDRINEIGRGRVWTGAQAKEHGLVDELGGLLQAVDLAKSTAGLPIDAEVPLVFYPRPKKLLEQLAEYASSRMAMSLPPVVQQLARVVSPWMFADGSVLALSDGVVEVR